MDQSSVVAGSPRFQHRYSPLPLSKHFSPKNEQTKDKRKKTTLMVNETKKFEADEEMPECGSIGSFVIRSLNFAGGRRYSQALKQRFSPSSFGGSPKWSNNGSPVNDQDHSNLYCSLEDSPLYVQKYEDYISDMFQTAVAVVKLKNLAKASNNGKDLSKKIVPLSTQINGHGVCLLEDSPVYIFRACAQGLIEVVERLLNEDPKKISLKDSKGWTCMHHASGRGKVLIIDLLLKQGADINAKDNDGSTPLHVAVEKNQKDSIDRLLVNKADPSILNEKSWAPLHFAVILNKPKMIEELLKFPDAVDVEIKGHMGKRPIHLAASNDFDECASILVAHGCKLCKSCDNGFFPMHCAAKNAASKTLKVLIEKGLENGYTASKMLEFFDKENNSALHLAVNSGDIETVQACLQFGAKVDSLQENKSTALHYACAQGTLAIVRLLYESHAAGQLSSSEEDETKNILLAKDILGMTPLHRAAMYDHVDVVEYLIEQRSSLDELDTEHRSPLLLAAVRGGSRSFRSLLEAGSDIRVKDNYKRNVLHYLVTYAVDQSGVIPEIERICMKDESRLLMNQKDVNGCTPLHLATREGNIKFTETLLKLGAIVNLKDNDDQSPLHFAARFGRYNTVRRLLESHAGPNIINETDGGGMTALHIASMNGHTKVVQLLLHKGALIHKDYQGRSPLHLAAENGYTQTIKMLLSFHINLLDQTCKKGNTALHYAAEANQASTVHDLLTGNCKYAMNNDDKTPMDLAIEQRYAEAAMAMIQHERIDDVLRVYNFKKHGCPLLRLIQHLPDVYKSILDRSYTKASMDPRSKNYWEKYNFQYMQVNVSTRREFKEKGNEIPPLFALNTMVQNGRIELLSHPVCLKFLNMKWLAYGFWFFFLTIILYMTFVISLTKSVIYSHLIKVAAVQANLTRVDYLENDTTDLASDFQKASINNPPEDVRTLICSIALIYVFLFALINMVKELVQVYQQRVAYFFDSVNYMEWSLYVTSILFAAPVLFETSIALQWECGSVALFIAWFNLLLYLRRLDTVGLYVVMFQQILRTILKVVFVFSVLFIAFGLTFYVLLWADVQGGFKTPFISIVHSIMFMMGDWNYVEVFAKPYFRYQGAGALAYPTLSFGFLLLFVVLIPILFVNLLIGLAVGDIEIVQRDANLKRLAMQVEYHTDLEEKLPQRLIEKVDKMEIVDYPNGCDSSKLLTNFGRFRALLGCSDMTSTLTSSGGGSAASISDGPVIANDALLTEINKSKSKLKEMQGQLDRMHELLKLVVQKMDISEEADEEPCGYSKPSTRGGDSAATVMSRSRTLRLRAKLAPIVAASKSASKKV